MNKLLPLLLIIVGIVVFLVGLLFNMQKWPDMFFGIYSGTFVMVIGLVLLFKKRQNGKTDNS
ncbi:hypothetical protein O71_10884 [Pontibacter sp. BAB1700]|nr:hypothetical protein O71_10884 [Pontibacter sp. BAB1700]